MRGIGNIGVLGAALGLGAMVSLTGGPMADPWPERRDDSPLRRPLRKRPGPLKEGPCSYRPTGSKRTRRRQAAKN
ncbi:hypothetical protein AEGHOMDF_3157 [Methylobacterium soli]|nr:hypothetical protein AEGHOMDF_3157 [Methylobacterium soli]